MWPGRIANRSELKGPVDLLDDPTRWIKWYGDHKFTEVSKVFISPIHIKFWKSIKI